MQHNYIKMNLEQHLEKYKLQNIDPGRSEYFTGFINIMMDEYDISREEIADKIHVSPATVSRWKEGKSTPPYSIVRKAIIEDLKKELV